MHSIAFLALYAVLMRSYTVADSVSLQTVQWFEDHPFGAADEIVTYFLSSDAGTITIGRRRGSFGKPMSETELEPKERGEFRWIWSTHPSTARPTAGGFYGFDSERIRWVHLGNLDAVDSWSIPICFPLAMVSF